MESQIITDFQIREYLLGRLDADSRLVEQIDIQILTEPDFSLSVDVVEDEIIEEYIEGKLTLEDKQAVEGYFLRPPERQSKLRKARLLVHHLSQNWAQSSAQTAVEEPTAALPFTSRRPQAALFRIPSLAAIAAALVFAVGLAYFLYQRHITGVAIDQSKRQIAQEGLQAVQPAPFSTVTLNLYSTGLDRGATNLPEITLYRSTAILHLEITLTAPAGLYHAQLLENGKPLLPISDHTATALNGGSVLQLDLPAQSLSTATYELALAPLGKSYWFRVKSVE